MTLTRHAHPSSRSPRGLLRVSALAAGAALLAGCAAPLPTPDPEGEPDPAPPVLTEAQEAEVLTAVGTALEEADAETDPELLEGRVTGPALRIRTSQLEVAAKRKKADLVTELPTDVQGVVVPTTQTWPRTSYAVSEQPENLQSPRLIALDQDSARDQYELWGWVQLLPGIEMPSFADPALGSEAVAADDDSLLVTPQDAVAQYVDVLNLASKSDYADTFEDDPFRTFLASEAKRQGKALKAADGKRSMSFETLDEPVHAVRTADGGAMVMSSLTSLETLRVEEGGKVSPATETQKSLFGDADPTNALKIRYDDLVALYVPPAESDEQVRLLGYTHVATAARTD
ncbi:hypothetical protein [Cellulosimicrobium arenosum]|uniref:DUF8094 domain-containing protein n=1 Tax=Cellulosimicrobium arenosum TaxID=2708133 RepID=A0A927PFV5_9MICO|nr:hypothetical protein [Cellulosimicrobium arenosum]MBD8080119.1 hypothetical protein [Cellulosimicrobium arenosum]